MDHVSAKELQKLIQGKADLYDAVVRNGYYLPKRKSSIITEEYLEGVIYKRYACPLYSEIRLKPCPSPPDKSTLIGFLQDYRQRNGA